MAYSDYGAFVYLNGERRRDKVYGAGFEDDDLVSRSSHVYRTSMDVIGGDER